MMKHRKTVAAVGVTAALATGGLLGATLGLPSISGAQDTTTTTTAPDIAPGCGQAREGRFGGARFGPKLDAAAEALGLTVDELRDAVADGTTLAEVAAEQGVDRQDLIDALVAAGAARLDGANASLPDRVAEMIDKPLDGHFGGRSGHRGGHGDAPMPGNGTGGHNGG